MISITYLNYNEYSHIGKITESLKPSNLGLLQVEYHNDSPEGTFSIYMQFGIDEIVIKILFFCP
jgi:hypothetical protein